jgi:hypothetical protein
MTAAELTASLEGVRGRGHGKWTARCPAHPDRSPSLSIAEGQKGLLLKCWAGCSVQEITAKLGVTMKDLFFDGDLPITVERRQALRQRAQERTRQQATYVARGRRMDALKEAENLVQSARSFSIALWSDADLDAALDRLGKAYALLESEDI